MFNKEQGLKDLEKVFNGEAEILTVQGLFALVSGEGLEKINNRHQQSAETTWKLRQKKIEDVEVFWGRAVEFRPNLVKEYVNESWMKYHVMVGGEVRSIGYINREKKIAIIDTEEKSAFSELNRRIGYYTSLKVEGTSDIDFNKLNEFTVISTNGIKENYEEMKINAVNRFFEENEVMLLTLVDENIKKGAEKELVERFIKDEIDEKQPSYAEFITPRFYVENKLMSVAGVLSEGLIFDFVENQSLLELMYMDLLHKNFFGETDDMYTQKSLMKLCQKYIREETLRSFENNYTVLLSREIVRAFSQCGKTTTIKLSNEDKPKKEEVSYSISNTCFGEVRSWMFDDMELIESISFGRKTLFNKAEFDEKYGHLKSTI